MRERMRERVTMTIKKILNLVRWIFIGMLEEMCLRCGPAHEAPLG